ncbi:hypothetical protein DXG01_015408 [Tephrocybe rancida]|nr:hypothetical protein DXG01_015408 [Tephrocybe rancida]
MRYGRPYVSPTFRDPRGPETNDVPYMPYQNMDPNDPRNVSLPLSAPQTPYHRMASNNPCNVPIPQSEGIWPFGYSGDAAYPPDTGETFYHQQQQRMLEPPPIPHHYPQPQFTSNVIAEEDPRVLYQQRVKAHNIEQDAVLRMLRLSREDFMAQARDLCHHLGFTSALVDAEGYTKKLLFIHDQFAKGKLMDPARRILSNDPEAHLTLNRLIKDINVSYTPRQFSDPEEVGQSFHITRTPGAALPSRNVPPSITLANLRGFNLQNTQSEENQTPAYQSALKPRTAEDLAENIQTWGQGIQLEDIPEEMEPPEQKSTMRPETLTYILGTGNPNPPNPPRGNNTNPATWEHPRDETPFVQPGPHHTPGLRLHQRQQQGGLNLTRQTPIHDHPHLPHRINQTTPPPGPMSVQPDHLQHNNNPSHNPTPNGTLERTRPTFLCKDSKKNPATAPTLHTKTNQDTPQEHREVSGGDSTREQNLTGEKPRTGDISVEDHKTEEGDTPTGEEDHRMGEEGPRMAGEGVDHQEVGPREVTKMEEDPRMAGAEDHQEDGCQEDPQADCRMEEEEDPWEAGASR